MKNSKKKKKMVMMMTEPPNEFTACRANVEIHHLQIQWSRCQIDLVGWGRPPEAEVSLRLSLSTGLAKRLDQVGTGVLVWAGQCHCLVCPMRLQLP